MTSHTPITVPPDIQEVIHTIAEAENRDPVDVLTDAVQEYAKASRLEKLTRWGQSHARHYGHTGDKVLSAIQEIRAESSDLGR
jgi:predicted transcriptional regulator